jgi:hypothetical protein
MNYPKEIIDNTIKNQDNEKWKNLFVNK